MSRGPETFILRIPVFIDILMGPDLVSVVNVTLSDGVWSSGAQGRTGSQATSSGLGWIRFDAVAVAEPSGLGLFLIGLAGVGLAKRRRR